MAYRGARFYGPHDPSFKATEVIYNASTNLIDATIYEERRQVSVPLTLQFEYKPSMGSAPIHEIVAGRNTRIKAFYWKLWYGDDQSLPELDIHDTFTGPEVTLQTENIEKFRSIVGNNKESFKSVRTDKVSAPMDFAIVAGWQVSTVSPFPYCLFLTHFFRLSSNRFSLDPSMAIFSNSSICRIASGWFKVPAPFRLATSAVPKPRSFLS